MENNKEQVKKLYRSNTNRILFGVCGGLGEYFGIDPIIFRLIFIALTLGAGTGAIVYIVLALIIPKAPSGFEGNPVKADFNDLKDDIKDRAHDLASEFKEIREERGHHNHYHRGGGVFRLFLGLLLLIIGFAYLVQNFNLFPGLYINFSWILKLWPMLIILIGFSIISRGARNY